MTKSKILPKAGKLFILVVLLLVALPIIVSLPNYAFAQVDTAWVRRYNGPGNSDDPAGNIDTNNAKEPLLLPLENFKGRSAKDFVTPDGRFDLKAIRASGYQGPLDLKGLNVGTDPHTGEPVLAPGNAKIAGDPDDIFWTDRFSCVNGLDGTCRALCVYDGKLIAGGEFQVANCTFAINIASWDGSSWSPLGSGMNGDVFALAVYDNKLIAGGVFTTAGGVSANYIASWDGSSWSPLGSGMTDCVLDLAVYDNKLIAGGGFTTAGGVSANSIASWDGSSWSPLGSGMNVWVYALAVYDNKLIAGGDFTTAGGVSANYIASWDGSSWSPLGSGMNSYGYVYDLAVYDNKLIAGGVFTTAGGVSANGIASWDGSSWSPLGSGMGGYNPLVVALTVYDNKLIAGGYFTTAGGVSANNIASWDGSSWSPLESGMNSDVWALAVYDNKLIAGGYFTTAGDVSANYIASWDGSSWSPLGSGINYYVIALAVYDNKLMAGGLFTTAGGASANYIASWDGSSWDSLGSGMNDLVYALAVYDNKLIAGGGFTTAGGMSANFIASWDGSSWSALGSGMNIPVYALAVYDNKLIAGGCFTTAGGVSANCIASWDGSSWSPLGSGMWGGDYAPYVFALAVYDNKLIAGGRFITAGGVDANFIASWNGSSWSPLGSGMGYSVHALAVFDNKLIAGGYFTTAGGVSANSIASWDGSSWSALGSGMNDWVYALAVYDNKLIAGGGFTTAGGDSANYIASWDGSSWSPLGSGMNSVVFALAVYDNKLIAGGVFTTAGGKVSAYIAQWTKHGENQPPTHVFIDSVRVWKHETGSYRIKLPNALDSIEVNDKICFYGHVADSSGAGVPLVGVTAFNAFGYNGAKSQGLDTVITDGSGRFVFPNPAEEPIGLLCEYPDLYPFWFAANDSVAIPIIIEAVDQTTTLEAITDTLIALYGPILSKFSPHDSVMIGIPDTTDPLFIKFSYYPPNPLNLDDPTNNHFMEGFVYNYHGPTDFRFLFDSTFTDTMVWLTRGAWFNNSRTKGVVDTLKNYFLGQPSVRVLAIKDEFGQWHNVANQNLVLKGFWDNVWNAISYGIEAGICAGAIVGTLGTAAPVACAPIVVHVVADVTKAVAVPFLCDEVIKAEDPEQCRSVGGAITDIGAGIANICVTGGIKNIISGTQTHLGYWLNPRNLAHGGLNGRLTAGARLYESATDWLGVGELYFNTVELEAQYFNHPSLSQFQAYGYDGLVFEPPDTLDMLYGTRVGRYITMVDPPIQNYDMVFSSPLDPPWLIVTVQANKPFYQDGTTNLVPPTIVIENAFGSLVVDPSDIHLNADSSRYWVWVLSQDLPGWVPGQFWFGRIKSSGSDIVSNLGDDSTSMQSAQSSSESDLTLTLEDGSNVYIPQNALDTSLYLSFGPSYQVGGGKFQDTSLFAARFLRHEYKLAPTNLQFNVPIHVGLKIDTLQFGDLGDSLLALVQFDSVAMEWTVIGTDIDSANSIIHGLTSKSGRFRAALMVEYLRGDANGDGVINVTDVVYLINYLFLIPPGPAPIPLEAGDVNCDGFVNVTDVVYLINYLFIGGPPPCR